MRNWLFILLAAFATTWALAKTENEKIFEEMTERIGALQRAALATDDATERLKIQREIQQVLVATDEKLTGTEKILFGISLKILRPTQELGEKYTAKIAEIANAGTLDFTSVSTREHIAERLACIDELDEMNTRLLARFSSLEQDIQHALDEGKVEAAVRQGFMEGFNSTFGRRIGPSKAIRTLDTALFAKFRAGFRLLEKHWGRWSITDGDLTWQDDAVAKEFAALREEIDVIIQRQSEAEKVLSERI